MKKKINKKQYLLVGFLTCVVNEPNEYEFSSSLIYQNFLKHFELNNNKFEVDSFSIHELFIKFESRIV